MIIQDASHIQSLEHKMRRELHAKGHVARYTLKDVVGHSAEMRSLVEHAELYANSPSSIFIYGESGTGKEIFAQGIHMASPFRNGPFVGINCTALPESLLESELFGYAEGAFRNAISPSTCASCALRTRIWRNWCGAASSGKTFSTA